MNALEKTRLWDVVKLSTDKQVPHSKFALKKKKNDDGTVAKYEARFFPCGNDDDERSMDSFAPGITFKLVKIFLNIPTQRKWHGSQADFDNAIVNGKLNREVHVGITEVCLLGKSSYRNSFQTTEEFVWVARSTKDMVRIVFVVTETAWANRNEEFLINLMEGGRRWSGGKREGGN